MVSPADGGDLDVTAARAWVDAFVRAVDGERDALGELDRQSGDGDFGFNMQTSLTRARADLAIASIQRPGDPFGVLSTAFLNTGGTSGPLYGMWFRELARAAGDRPTIGLDAIAHAVAAGTQAVQRLGGAVVGDKTMVDAMEPAAQALRDARAAGLDLRAALVLAAEAARRGADSTAALLARRGRASYVGEVARGVLDPGAVAVAIFFEAGPEALEDHV